MSTNPADRARLFLERGDHLRALGEAGRARGEDPEDLEAIAIEAEALSGLERHDEAVATAERLVGGAPDAWWAHALHSALLRAASRFDEALAAAATAMAIAPDQPGAWLESAAGHLGREEFTAALDATGHALALAPEFRDAELIRSYALLGLNRRAEAKEAVRAILARSPEDAAALAALARADLLDLRFADAADGIRSSLVIDAADPESRALYMETVRARTPIGRIVYGWGIVLDRFPKWGQWALIGGLWLIVRLLTRGPGAEAIPTPARVAIVAAYAFLCVLTWFGPRIIDLYLRMRPEMRPLLAERRAGSKDR